ncbi:DoxX family protein [Chitinophagaceae bacterium MMS25-I14]
MKYILLAGRILFSFIFLVSAAGHFSGTTISYAAAAGVPAASFMVPLSGIIELLGGLSILLGYKAKWGAWLIVLFLVPVTFYMHAFWKITDPMAKQMDMAAFMKNVSMLGAALMISYLGSGPLSLDNRSKTVSAN